MANTTDRLPTFSKPVGDLTALKIDDSANRLLQAPWFHASGGGSDMKFLLCRMLQWADLVLERQMAFDLNPQTGTVSIGKASLRPRVVPGGADSPLAGRIMYGSFKWIPFTNGGNTLVPGVVSDMELDSVTGNSTTRYLVPSPSMADMTAAMEAYAGLVFDNYGSPSGRKTGWKPKLDAGRLSDAVTKTCGPKFSRAYASRSPVYGTRSESRLEEIGVTTTESRTAYQVTSGEGIPQYDEDDHLTGFDQGDTESSNRPAMSNVTDSFHDDPEETLNESNMGTDPYTVYDLDYTDETIWEYKAVTDLTDGNYRHNDHYDPLSPGPGGWEWLATDAGAYTYTEKNRHHLKTYTSPVFTWTVRLSGPFPDGVSAAARANELFPVTEPWYVGVKVTTRARSAVKESDAGLPFDERLHFGSVETVRWTLVRLDMTGRAWTADQDGGATIGLRATAAQLLAVINAPAFQSEDAISDPRRDIDEFRRKIYGHDGEAYLDANRTFLPYVPRQRLL